LGTAVEILVLFAYVTAVANTVLYVVNLVYVPIWGAIILA